MKKHRTNLFNGAQILENIGTTVSNVTQAAGQTQALLNDATRYSALIKQYGPAACIMFVALVLLTLTNTILLVIKD